MKQNLKIVLGVWICCFVGCQAKKSAQISFGHDTLRFTAQSNQEMLAEFKFINSGQNTLHIHSADADCGCLSVEYPQAPILPGESGVVRVKYTAGEKSGEVSRLIVLEANTTPTLHTLVLLGKVESPH
jgi:hypothetical protein